ncbi:MAG: porin family protein [Rikenella sp.]|nr:porin family protein [Rikenella sp.]
MQTIKRIFPLVVVLLLGTAVRHTASAQGFYWGPRAGLNVSTLTKTSYSKARARANFGLMAGYKINDLIGVQAEALYSMQGSKMTNKDDVFSYNYVKVPLLAKIFLIGGLNIEAGVSFDWLVRAQHRWTSKDYTGGESSEDYATVSHSQNLLKDSRRFDLSIPVGINYQFSKLFDIGVRYDISTIRTAEDSQNRAKNSNWSVSVGLRF